MQRTIRGIVDRLSPEAPVPVLRVERIEEREPELPGIVTRFLGRLPNDPEYHLLLEAREEM